MSGPVFERAKWYEDARPAPRSTVLVEHTGKELKAVMLIGGIGCALGVVLAMATTEAVWLIVSAVGTWSWLVARIMAWWNHG